MGGRNQKRRAEEGEGEQRSSRRHLERTRLSAAHDDARQRLEAARRLVRLPAPHVPIDAFECVLRHAACVHARLAQHHVAPARDRQDVLLRNRPVEALDDPLEAAILRVHVVPAGARDSARGRLLLLHKDRLKVGLDVNEQVEVGVEGRKVGVVYADAPSLEKHASHLALDAA